MNDIERAKDNLADATSTLDSLTWLLEERGDEKILLTIVASIRSRVDTALAIL